MEGDRERRREKRQAETDTVRDTGWEKWEETEKGKDIRNKYIQIERER